MTSYTPSNEWTFRNNNPSPGLDVVTAARPPPKSPRLRNSTLKVFQSVFNRHNTTRSHHTAATPSLHSSFSASSARLADSTSPIQHPFAPMPPAPVPVVSSHDPADDEQECPVCLEPLSFSFRLPGEKPHVVPECGHSLHEVTLPSTLAKTLPSCFPRLASPQFMAHLRVSHVLQPLANQTWASVVCADDP